MVIDANPRLRHREVVRRRVAQEVGDDRFMYGVSEPDRGVGPEQARFEVARVVGMRLESDGAARVQGGVQDRAQGAVGRRRHPLVRVDVKDPGGLHPVEGRVPGRREIARPGEV